MIGGMSFGASSIETYFMGRRMKSMEKHSAVSYQGSYLNSGNGPTIQLIDIEHPNYMALIEPDTAFWSLVKKKRLADALTNSSLLRQYQSKQADLSSEMKTLRF